MTVLRMSSPREVLASEGKVLGVSDWFVIDQERVDLFARATDDHQWIHVDEERAASGPFGGTIAHGYLVLSLVPRLSSEVFHIEGAAFALNYGLDRVRFVSPVPTGSRIRAEVRMVEVVVSDDDTVRMNLETIIRLEGVDKPACVCQGIGLVKFGASESTSG